MQQITKEMTIAEIFSTFPDKSQKLAQEITSAGLHCVGCGAATWETLEAGMLGHGFAEEEIDTLIGKLNSVLLEKTDPSTIQLTAAAAKKYHAILKEEGKEGWGLRFGVRAGGCSGFEYELDYAKEPLPGDEVFHSEGISIFVQKSMVENLRGAQIDYVDSLHSSGFKISNPKAKGSCGCGKSQTF